MALRELAARKVRDSLVGATTEEIERLAAGPEEGVEQLSKSLMSLKPEFERAVQRSPEVSKTDDTKGGSSIIFATPPQGIGKAGGEEPGAPPSAIPQAAGSPPDWMGGQDLFGIREVLKQNANLTALLMDQSRRESGSTTIVRIKDEQIKIPRFKDIDADKGITVSHLLLEWETYFKNKEVSPTVMAVLQAIDKGGNLYNWISSKTLTHAAALDDPDNINNWEWDRFKSEIFASSLHTPVDQGAIFDAVSNFAFKSCTSIDHIRDEVTRYEIAVNKANAASLSENLPPAYLANKLYRSLPDDFRNLMAQRNSKYSSDTKRSSYVEIRKEIADVLLWPVTVSHYKQRPVQVRANAAPTAAPTTFHQRRVGGDNDYVVFIKVPKQFQGASGTAIDEGLLGLRSNDTRFGCARKPRVNGDEFVIITHPQESTLKNLEQQKSFRIIQPFLQPGEIKAPIRNIPKAKSKGQPPVAAAASAPTAEASALADMKKQLDAMREELQTHKTSPVAPPPLPPRGDADNSAALLAAAAGPTKTSGQALHVMHPSVTGKPFQSYTMPSAHDSAGARVAILPGVSVTPIGGEVSSDTTDSAMDCEDIIARCMSLDHDLWEGVFNQADFDNYKAIELFRQVYPDVGKPPDHGPTVLVQSEVPDPETIDFECIVSDIVDMAIIMADDRLVQACECIVSDIVDMTIIMADDRLVQACECVCEMIEICEIRDGEGEDEGGQAMSVSAATITPHVVDDAYIQSSDMSWHKGAWASLMHARMGHINNGEFEALRFSTRHVSSSMSRVEALRAIDAEFQQLRTFGDAAPPAGKVTLKPRKRGARARARHGKAVDGHLCHVGPRYYGANLREPADYQSPPPLPTPSLIRERSNSVVYRTSRTWRGLLRGDEMSAILCVLVSLPLPNTTGHLWPYDGITTTPTWAHIVAIIGVTANVDMAVFYDIMLIGVALLCRGFAQVGGMTGAFLRQACQFGRLVFATVLRMTSAILQIACQIGQLARATPAMMWGLVTYGAVLQGAAAKRPPNDAQNATACQAPTPPVYRSSAILLAMLAMLVVLGVTMWSSAIYVQCLDGSTKTTQSSGSMLASTAPCYSMPPAGGPYVTYANPAHTASAQDREAIQAARACASLNCAQSLPSDARLAMLDSGTTDAMFQNDDLIQQMCVDYDRSEASQGQSANSSFSTDGKATVGIGFDYATSHGTSERYNLTARVTLCSNWNFDLVPPRFFQCLGHDVFFHGRRNLHDQSDGETELVLNQLKNEGKEFLGRVHTVEWANLSFLPYYLFSPTSAPISAAAHIAGSRGARSMMTVKYHVIFGHASMRRVRACLAPVGVNVASELPCPCPICAETASEMPSRRSFQRLNVSKGMVQGTPFEPADELLTAQMQEMLSSDASAPDEAADQDFEADELHTAAEFQQMKVDTASWDAIDQTLMQTPDHELHTLQDDASFPMFGLSVRRKSVRPGQIWHCDTIPLPGQCWDKITQALVLVDDYSRKVYVYGMKSKNGETTASHIRQHFVNLGLDTNPESINFFTHRMVLHSDQGSEFINHNVAALCKEMGCAQEFSCPGDSGKWQNGVVERRIKELGNVARKLMRTSNMMPEGRCHALYHAADIINALPTSANPGGRDSTGLPPDFVYNQKSLDLDHWYAFGSQCFAHLDSDHASDDVNIQAASCVYLCQAHHVSASGHVVWDLNKRRRMTVPKITQQGSGWNCFPLRPQGQQHLSMFMTWVAPPVESTANAQVTDDSLLADPQTQSLPTENVASCDQQQPETKHRQMMLRNVGKEIRKVFFINGLNGPLDYYEGTVHHVTDQNRYHIVYWDGDSEDLTHPQFLRYHRDQDKKLDIIAQAATLLEEAQTSPPSPPTCNCHQEHEVCHHPWCQPVNSYQTIAAMGIDRKVRLHSPEPSSGTQTYVPTAKLPSTHELDYYAMLAFGHYYSNVDVQQVLNEACVFKFSPINPTVVVPQHEACIAAAARKRKTHNLSAYPADPMSIPQCMMSPDWQTTDQGNTWCESILSEWGNFKRFDVVESVSKQDVPDHHDILPTIINFLTKRQKDSTPALPVVDKRKTRICLGGHKCVPGVHFERQEAYAPVPTWSIVKLQLALTALHGLKLKAFDATAAYLQTPMEKEVYCQPPKGLIDMLNEQGEGPFPKDTVWRLKRCLYGHPLGAALWYRKLFTFLKSYGFEQLGNSASFLMLKRTTGEHQGTIILNVYSDDGLASIDNEELWRQFMTDFKEKFEVVEKDPDYFLGAGIIQHEDGSVEIDPSKYLRESVAKYDMHHAVTSPLPMPAGSKLYMDHGAHLGDDGINLFQQMTGTIMYASLLRPELCYYASQLGKVMSAPSEPHMVLARKVLQYISGTLDEKHTFHPCGHKGFRPEDLSLQAFSDSDWACSVDTRRSHGCYIIMLAGAAVSHRSRTHKSIMLSTAAAEYYEASEACREIAFVRGILEGFYGKELGPTPLYIDNQACIAMGRMPQFTEKQKHIPIRICHLKECCDDKMVQLRPVATYNELADIGTKALALPAFNRLKQVINGQISFSMLLENPPK